MTFNGDEFVKNDLKKFDKSFVQIEDYQIPEARPIGEVLSMIGTSVSDFDEVKTSAMISRTADQDRAILGGSSLNDDEDEQTTLESLKSAEKMSGKQLNKVDATKENAARTGSYIHNFLEDDHRVYTSEVDNALADKGAENAKANADRKAQQERQALVQQQAKQNQIKEQKATDEIAIHFMDDGYVQTHEATTGKQHTREESDSESSDSDSDSD